MCIPRFKVFVTDRPINSEPVTNWAFEIEIAETLCLAGPKQTLASYVISAYPTELETTMDYLENISHGITIGDEPMQVMRATRTKPLTGEIQVTVTSQDSGIFTNRKLTFFAAMPSELAEVEVLIPTRPSSETS